MQRIRRLIGYLPSLWCRISLLVEWNIKGEVGRRRLSYEALEFRRLLAVGDLRIANYNVLGFDGTPSADVGTIIKAIGDEVYNGRSRPVDVLAIQEVRSQATTTAAVVSQLNAIYGAGKYARGNLNGSALSANETMGLIYNTSTIQLVSEVGIGTTGTNGAPRQPIRYQLRPLELPAGNDFYLYNSHMKASDTASDQARRNVEATTIRADADALGAGTHIIYAGDFNLKTSSEAAYQTMLSAGAGQARDPLNRPGNWNGNAAFTDIFTQAPAVSPPSGFVGGGINDRFDLQLQTYEWGDNTGLEYLANSYHTFGNNGSVAMNGNINAATSTALPGLSNRTTILNLLTTTSDHLPLVADYFFAPNLAPTSVTLSANTIAENAASNILVGNFTTTDPNLADTHTYSLVAGSGSTNNSSFTISGNTLRSAAGFALDGTANYTIRVRTTDNGGLSFEAPLTISVTNVAPTVTAANASVTGLEGTAIANSGTYGDIAADTVTITSSVGTAINNGNGTWSWSITPTDNVPATTVTITARDEDGGSRTVTFTYTATNAAPLVSANNATVSGNEGTAVANSGTYSDVSGDTVTLSASSGTVTKNANGTWNWSITQPDNQSNTTVSITASDEDGGSRVTTFAYSVLNVAPNVTVSAASVAVNEGQMATNSGTYGDVPADTVTMTASVGTVSILNGVWSWSLPTSDDLPATLVTITASDEDGGQTLRTFTYASNNVAPSVNRSLAIVSGNVLTVLSNTGTYADVPADVVTLSVSQGAITKNLDGTWNWTVTPSALANNQDVTVTATDDDGGSSVVTFSFTALVNIPSQKLFYNDSGFETVGGVSSALDNSKSLLRSSAVQATTSFANVSNYSKGINGLVFDVAGLASNSLSASDFIFRASPTGLSGVANPSIWPSAPNPSVVNVTPGTATTPAVVRLEWADNAIQNVWLQVIVRANANTGLVNRQVYYIGHALGEVDGLSPYRVSTTDVGLVRSGVSNAIVSASDVRDLDKDRRITTSDVGFVRSRVGNTVLIGNITVPASGSGSEGEDDLVAPWPTVNIPSNSPRQADVPAISAQQPIVPRITEHQYLEPSLPIRSPQGPVIANPILQNGEGEDQMVISSLANDLQLPVHRFVNGGNSLDEASLATLDDYFISIAKKRRTAR